MTKDKRQNTTALPPTQPLAPGWDVLVLVCKACRKRSSGPSGPKAKALAAELRQTGKDMKLKTRCVQTSCMGLCPRGTTAVVVAPRHGPANAMAWPPHPHAGQAAELFAAAETPAASPALPETGLHSRPDA